ncbi:response regulator transcription factor [Nocardioides xinjiangensis]|uniref:response regulator transcription factor n=1 Tax=Nocardioides xinjiangensis TaxID=2817376 RepID=UPI001FEE77EA
MLDRMVHDVLVVEDEEDIAVPLMRTLEREGYEVNRVSGGAEAVSFVVDEGPAVVILDLGLPDMDGIDVCRQMRSGGYLGGIIMVTARAGELDRVVGLDVGADDYLAKPFGLAELLARVRALLRRSGNAAAQDDTAVTTASGLRIDAGSRRVHLGEKEIALTAKEFDVLAVLATHHDKVVPRETLMTEVWDQNWYGSTKTLDVTIGRLRHKLEAAEAGERVVAIRGVGFRLETGT